MRIDNISSTPASSVRASKEISETVAPEQVAEQNTTQPAVEEIKRQQVEEKEVDEKVLDKSIEQANKSLSAYNRRIERAIHETTKTMMYSVIDTTTDEVIHEFPPKKIQDMIAKMWELAGLFVDEKA